MRPLDAVSSRMWSTTILDAESGDAGAAAGRVEPPSTPDAALCGCRGVSTGGVGESASGVADEGRWERLVPPSASMQR